MITASTDLAGRGKSSEERHNNKVFLSSLPVKVAKSAAKEAAKELRKQARKDNTKKENKGKGKGKG